MAIPGISGQNATQSIGKTTQKNSGLASLQDQYPDLNLSAGTNITSSYLANANNKYMVMVDPAAIRRAETDEGISQNLHETLGNVQTIHDEVESLVTAGGMKLRAVITKVDRDGKDAGGIVIVDSPSSGGSKSESLEKLKKLQEELREKRKMEVKEREKKTEEKKAAEESEKTGVDISISVDVSVTSLDLSGENTSVSAPVTSSESVQQQSSESGAKSGIDYNA